MRAKRVAMVENCMLIELVGLVGWFVVVGRVDEIACWMMLKMGGDRGEFYT